MRSKSARTSILVLALTALLSTVPQPAHAVGYSVVVDGQTLANTPAEMRSGQLMVSVRPFMEAMGGGVSWNADAKMTTAGYNGSQIAFWIGNNLSFQNGTRIWAPVAPYLSDGKTMVPAWWLATRFGVKVSFSGSTLTVNTGRPPATAPAPKSVLANANYVFPFATSAAYDPYSDTMGAARYWQGETFAHEGIDILAPKGTPIVAVASGTVIRYGWNTLGGYRLTVQLDDQPAYKFYYAHMDRYATGIYEGAKVKAGQVIGYVGSTGEGPERTEGKFVNHLHFAIYDANFNAIPSYELLRYWEANKVTLP